MKTPEQIELEQKQSVLETLELEYSAAELEYNTLVVTLDIFRSRYYNAVGSLYAQLDEARARIQEAVARQHVDDPAASRAAEAAREHANATAKEIGRAILGDAEPVGFTPSDELKALYRRAVKLIHPDRAENEEDRRLRDRLMAEINTAYRRGDIDAINRVLAQYNEILSTPKGDDIGAQLVRVIRIISKTRSRIAALAISIAELQASEWCRLKTETENDEAAGLEPLTRLAAKLRGEIVAEEATLALLKSKMSDPPL